MRTDERIEFSYLANFKQEEVEGLLIEYEQYIKLSNSVRIPIIIVLVVGGIMRSMKHNMSSNQFVFVIIAIIILLAFFAWLVAIAYRIIKQKKFVKNKLKAMASVQNYPFNEVKKEFNTLVRATYKGPKV
ncbi:hypothetical protein MWU76_08885 [Gelidibacter sp. F2691]|nr:hypothetical protein [Gelidibacter sp. F2691]